MTENKYTWVIGRHINGITINPLEYVLDENDEIERFIDKQGARQFLVENHLEPDDYIIKKLKN